MRSPQTFQRLGSSLIILGLLISFKTCDCATPGPAPKPANITTVCAAKGVNTPFVSCQPDGKADDFTGFDVEAFRKIASLLPTPWIPDKDYELKCLSFEDMFANLQAANGSCDIGLGGITISQSRIDKGLRFAYPTYRTSLAPLVESSSSSADGWNWTQAFQLDLWLAIIATAIVLPWLMFALEYLALQGYIGKDDIIPGMKESQWRATWTTYGMEPFNVSSTAARVLAIVFGLFAMIFIQVLQASLTSQLTVNNVKSNINSAADLVGKAVVTLDIYEKALKEDYNLQPVVEPLVDEGTLTDWVARLRAGTLAAVLIDAPLNQYLSYSSGGCDLKVAPVPMVDFDLGFVFAPNVKQELIDQFSAAILYIQEDGTLTQLRDSFINLVNPQCTLQLNAAKPVTMSDVFGLWVLLAASIAIAFILVGLIFWNNARKANQKRQRKLAALEAAKSRARRGGSARRGLSVKTSSGVGGSAFAANNELDHEDILALHSDSSDSENEKDDDEDDDDDDDDDDVAEPTPTRVPHLPALGVAFKQKISMFGLHLAYNKQVLKYMQGHPAAGTTGAKDTTQRGGVNGVDDDQETTVGLKLVDELMGMCDELEAVAGINTGTAADASVGRAQGASTMPRARSLNRMASNRSAGGGRTIDEGMSEGLVYKDYGQGSRRTNVVDDRADEARG